MNLSYFKVFILLLLLFAGCIKDKNNNLQLLTSNSWEQVEGFYDGEHYGAKFFHKVSFGNNGQFEFIINPHGLHIDNIAPDTIVQTGKYNFEEASNTIVFESIIYATTDSINNCDTMQRYIAIWEIIEFNDNVMKIHGHMPDTTNHTPCFFVYYIGNYYFKPYLE